MNQQIKFLNLTAEHKDIQRQLDKAILAAVHKGDYIQGEAVKDFENNLAEFLSVKHVITCANGTDALQIAMMALGLKIGDEVIMPTFTYVATAEAVAILGIKPIFIDVDPNTFTIDTHQIESKITDKTKAILPVHLFGQCADMDEIIAIAKAHDLAVIEDTAQALGSSYKDNISGTIGDIGTTSFFPSKNLGAMGDGGAVFTNNSKLAKKIRMITQHGQSKKYHHNIIGLNSRLDTIQAVILNIKLQYLEQKIHRRQQHASLYDTYLLDDNNIQLPLRNYDSTHTFHQYSIKVEKDKRDFIRKRLYDKGIDSMVYYPIPIHLQEAYQYLAYQAGDFPISEQLCNELISLPIHPKLNSDDISYISDCIKTSFS